MAEKLAEDFNKNVTIQSECKESEFTNNEKIGEGTFAAVYKALHKEFGYVAIKKIYFKSSVRVSNSTTEFEQELSEVDIMIKHSHPNIVRVYGLLMPDVKHFSEKYIGYIMELMEHGSLYRIIHDKEKKYSTKQVFSWMWQAALGILYLHKSKIIHRDVKPANFLIGKHLDNLKISDFGLAKPLTRETTITRGVGTYAYMSPELLDEQLYSYPSDIYALAISFWEMANRRRPYDHLEMSEFRIVGKILNDNERPQIETETPLNSLLQRGWQKEPSLRPAVEEFRDFANKAFEEADDSQMINVGGKDLSKKLTQQGLATADFIPEYKFSNFEDTSQILCVGIDSETVSFREQIKNSVMILGGYLYSIGVYRDPVYTDSICIFNSKKSTCNLLNTKLPHKLAFHGSVMINDEIYIFGGYEGQKYLKESYKLGENMEWIDLADMNEKRADIGNSSVVFKDEIWVFGGWNGKNWLKSVEKYNPMTDTWTVMSEMNTEKCWSAVSIINGKFYVSGGNNLETIEIYDPEKKKWEIFCEMPLALSRHTSIADGTNLIIIKGDKSEFEPSDEVLKIDVLDPKKKWIKMPNLNQKRIRHSAVKLSDGLMVIGGLNRRRRIIDTLEIFDGHKWTEREVDSSNWRSESSFIPLTTKNETLFLQRDDLLKRSQFLYDKKLIAEGSIMLLGGWSGYLNDSIYIYNSKEKEWNKIYLKLPSKLFGHGSVVINSEIYEVHYEVYIFGGYKGQEYLEEPSYSKKLYKLGENMEWIQLADMNEKRFGIGNSSVVFEDELWIFGGENGNWLKSVEKYNPITDTWTKMPEMNQEKSWSAVSIINGKFYVSGGADGKNPLKTIEAYDPERKKWEIFCEMPLALCKHASIVVGTNLIIIGGDKFEFEPSDEVWKINVLDPEKKWIKMPNLNKKRHGHGAIKLPDGLMVIGGAIDDKTELDSVEIFDGTNWTEGNKLSEELTGFSLIQSMPKE